MIASEIMAYVCLLFVYSFFRLPEAVTLYVILFPLNNLTTNN